MKAIPELIPGYDPSRKQLTVTVVYLGEDVQLPVVEVGPKTYQANMTILGKPCAINITIR